MIYAYRNVLGKCDDCGEWLQQCECSLAEPEETVDVPLPLRLARQLGRRGLAHLAERVVEAEQDTEHAADEPPAADGRAS